MSEPLTVGRAVRLIREHAGADQAAFAARLGVGRGWVSHVEGGRFSLTDSMADRIREAYGFCPRAMVVLSEGRVDWTRHLELLAAAGRGAKE